MCYEHIIATADWHLGKRQYGIIQREEDFYNSALEIIKGISGNSVILNAGDILDSNLPRSKALAVLKDIDIKLKGKFSSLFYIEGNHDKSDPPWIKILNTNTAYGIKLLEDGIWKEIQTNVYVIGFKEQPKQILFDKLKNIEDINNTSSKKILLLHASCRDFTGCNFNVNSIALQEIPNLDIFDFVIIGDTHISKVIQINNTKSTICISPGSIETVSASEDPIKYIYNIDVINHNAHALQIPSRKIIKLQILNNEDFEALIQNIIENKSKNTDPIYYIKIYPDLLDSSRINTYIKDTNIIIRYNLLYKDSDLKDTNEIKENESILSLKEFSNTLKNTICSSNQNLLNIILDPMNENNLKESIKINLM